MITARPRQEVESLASERRDCWRLLSRRRQTGELITHANLSNTAKHCECVGARLIIRLYLVRSAQVRVTGRPSTLTLVDEL